METEGSIWLTTLEDFRKSILRGDSITGGVAVAAISATLAMSIVRMVLAIASRKGGPPLEGLMERTQSIADRLAPAADNDRAAYAAYVNVLRLPKGSAERHDATEAALIEATRTPLAAARAASDGLEICVEAAGLVRGDIAADIGGAAALLGGAVRAILVSADANLRRLQSHAAHPQLSAERHAIERKAAALSSLLGAR